MAMSTVCGLTFWPILYSFKNAIDFLFWTPIAAVADELITQLLIQIGTQPLDKINANGNSHDLTCPRTALVEMKSMLISSRMPCSRAVITGLLTSQE